jgi:hypothetical protein
MSNSAAEIAPRSPGDSAPIGTRSSAVRPRVAGLDGRGRAAKRLRIIAADMEAQLPAPLTDAMRALMTRAAELALAAELARGKLVRGEAVAIAEVVKLENLAARAWRDLHHRAAAAKPAGPTLQEYLRNKAAASA